MISITKAAIEMARKALMNLYNLPLFLLSSSSSSLLISDKAILFFTEKNADLEAIASLEMYERTLWALRRRTHVNCLVLTAFCLSRAEFESLISTKEILFGLSIVTTTELGAIFSKTRDTQMIFLKNKNELERELNSSKRLTQNDDLVPFSQENKRIPDDIFGQHEWVEREFSSGKRYTHNDTIIYYKEPQLIILYNSLPSDLKQIQ